LCELPRPIAIRSTIAQVRDMRDRYRCHRDGQGDEGRAHPSQGGLFQHEIMDSPVGARHHICHEFRSAVWVIVQPGCSRSRPLCGHGHGGLGRNISCRVPTHSVCHDPDATVIQKSQCILIRGANITCLGSTDSSPLLGLCHGATSIGLWLRAIGNPTEGGPNRTTISSYSSAASGSRF
jgi:hypothetical protein